MCVLTLKVNTPVRQPSWLRISRTLISSSRVPKRNHCCLKSRWFKNTSRTITFAWSVERGTLTLRLPTNQTQSLNWPTTSKKTAPNTLALIQTFTLRRKPCISCKRFIHCVVVTVTKDVHVCMPTWDNAWVLAIVRCHSWSTWIKSRRFNGSWMGIQKKWRRSCKVRWPTRLKSLSLSGPPICVTNWSLLRQLLKSKRLSQRTGHHVTCSTSIWTRGGYLFKSSSFAKHVWWNVRSAPLPSLIRLKKNWRVLFCSSTTVRTPCCQRKFWYQLALISRLSQKCWMCQFVHRNVVKSVTCSIWRKRMPKSCWMKSSVWWRWMSRRRMERCKKLPTR